MEAPSKVYLSAVAMPRVNFCLGSLPGDRNLKLISEVFYKAKLQGLLAVCSGEILGLCLVLQKKWNFILQERIASKRQWKN